MKVQLITILIAGSTVLLSWAKPAVPDENKERNKRSIFKDGDVLKRSFDTLDLDLLFSDPLFQEFENDLKSFKQNSFPDLDETDAEEAPEKANEFDPEPENAVSNELLDLPELTKEPLGFQDLAHYKDEMSNVIPGSQGPFDVYNPYEDPFYTRKPHYPPVSAFTDPFLPSPHEMEFADATLDEFLEFLELKQSGQLDACLGLRGRK